MSDFLQADENKEAGETSNAVAAPEEGANEIGNGEVMSNSPLITRIAFSLWLALLLISLATFAVGLLGHALTLLGAPWISLKTQAFVHAGIPVFLTMVKFVTVPLLLVLTPFASRHHTFESWTEWSKDHFHKLEKLATGPFNFVKRLFSRRDGK